MVTHRAPSAPLRVLTLSTSDVAGGAEAMARNLRLGLTLEPTVPRAVRGDAGLLRQVLVSFADDEPQVLTVSNN